MSSSRLSRRERQILDALYRLRRATAAELERALPDAPSNSALRTHLRILLEKGHVTYHRAGRSYVYAPALPKAEARRQAMRHFLRTYCGGDPAAALATLVEAARPSPGDLEAMGRLLRRPAPPDAGA